MLWRKMKLDWRYAVGELFIVTIGVLIALAINSWNSERIARAEQADIVLRLQSDVATDLIAFGRRLQFLDEKESSLVRVRIALSSGIPNDPKQFLNDVVVGANYGWNQGSAQRTTFNDLLGSGKLSVISDPDVRAAIADYYESYETEHVRIDERETDFPRISYQIVPRGDTFMSIVGAIEGQAETGLSEEFIADRLEAAQDTLHSNHVVAEINLARFIRGVTMGLQADAENLASILDEYLAKLK